jgi:hypothetical protein
MLSLSLVVLNRQPIQPIPLDIPDRYMPGQPAPQDVFCDWYTYGMDEISCHRDEYYMSLNRCEHMIVGVNKLIKPRPLGDFILAWGTPTAIARSYGSTYVYWGNKSVWVWGSLKPWTRVDVVQVHLDPGGTEPWQGFGNK